MDEKRIQELFPKRFDFFDYGRIEGTSKAHFSFENTAAIVLFRMIGDDVGFAAVGFNSIPHQDESMAVEIANILTSKFAAQLSEASGEKIEISPPQLFKNGEARHQSLAKLIGNALSYRFITTRWKVGPSEKMSENVVFGLAYLTELPKEA